MMIIIFALILQEESQMIIFIVQTSIESNSIQPSIVHKQRKGNINLVSCLTLFFQNVSKH